MGFLAIELPGSKMQKVRKKNCQMGNYRTVVIDKLKFDTHIFILITNCDSVTNFNYLTQTVHGQKKNAKSLKFVESLQCSLFPLFYLLNSIYHYIMQIELIIIFSILVKYPPNFIVFLKK